jgi:hypothetical protein
VVLVPYEVKLIPFMMALRYDWFNFPAIVTSPDDEILCIAHLTFWGHEVGTGRETLFRASVSVNFADIVRKSKREY